MRLRHSLLGTYLTVQFVSITPTIYAADYYIDATNGNDAHDNPASFETAWQSFHKLNNEIELQAGDNVYLKRGSTWRETLLISETGSESAPITIGPHPGDDQSLAMPVISCTREISQEFWQGILSNGGFEIPDEAMDSIQRQCDCPDSDNSPAQCNLVTQVFANWTDSGSGTFTINQDYQVNIYNSGLDLPGGPAAKLTLVSPESSAGLRSRAITLPAKSQDDPILYTLSGFVRSEPGTEVEIQLYSSSPHKKYLVTDESDPDSGVWVSANDTLSDVKPVFKSTNTTGWEMFNINFTGIRDDNDNLVDARTLYVRAHVKAINGESNISGWVDDIKIVRSDIDYWSVSTLDNHGPNILIKDGTRVDKPTTEWTSTTHATGGPSYTLRYAPYHDAHPSEESIEISRRRVGIKLDGAEFIDIRDIEVKGCDRSLSKDYGQELRSLGYACDGAGILLANGSSYNTISNVLLKDNDEGIRVQGAGPGNKLNIGNVFDSIEVYNGRSQGIALRNHALSNVIRNCVIHNIAPLDSDYAGQDIEGISIGGSTGNAVNSLVENCEVFNHALNANMKSSAIPIFNSPNTTIRNNYIHDIGQAGISLGSNNSTTPGTYNLIGSSNTEIYGNIISRTGVSPVTNAGGSISIGASPFTASENIKIFNNTLHDCRGSDNKNAGIALRSIAKTCNSLTDWDADAAACMTYTENNIVYSAPAINAHYTNEQGEYLVGKLITPTIKNNIIEPCSGSRRALFVGGTMNIVGAITVIDPEINYNLYKPDDGSASFITYYPNYGTGMPVNYSLSQFENYTSNTGLDAQSFADESLLVDPEGGDFHLASASGSLPSSPAIDAGDPEDAYDNEPIPNGCRIDIGAYGNTSEATPSDIVCGNADLSVELVPSTENAIVGDILTYSIIVTNHGPDAASNVLVDGSLPECSIGIVYSGEQVSCERDLATTTTGHLIQTMTVEAAETDPDESNNVAMSSTNVQGLLAVAFSGSGTGTVTSEPIGINCSSDCSIGYDAGTSVNLTATADNGSAMAGWAGCDTSTDLICTVTMNDSRLVMATFVTPPIMPADLSAQAASSNEILLSWSDTSNEESGFVIERSSPNANVFVAIASASANTSTYTDTDGISRNTWYYYRIKAYNQAGDSAYSSIQSTRTTK
jgi:uncharacterized repeat protein (TIGR01451 family)